MIIHTILIEKINIRKISYIPELNISKPIQIGGRYFEFKWTSFLPECGETISDQEHGSFKSPGYPSRYPDNRDCVWTIYADYGKRITFHFATLNLEHHPNCSYDFLKVNNTK